MNTATYSAYPPQLRVTRLRRGVWLLPLLLLALLLGGVLWLLQSSRKGPETVAQVQDTGNWVPWIKKPIVYEPAKEAVAATPVERDLVKEELTRLNAQLRAQQQRLEEQQRMLEELAQRPAAGIADAPPPPPPTEKPAAPPPAKRKAAPMLFVQHEVKEDKKTTSEPTYTVMPGSYINCAIETAMNSDTGDFKFVAMVPSTVYDTETGRYPLILQGSKIVGEAQGSQLLYGNERIRTVSLTLSRRHDKTPIDLGEAPITDQVGMAGLTGKVDQHYGRLFGAVFIGGALRGGTQAMQTAITGAGPIGHIGGGIGQAGGQVVQGQTSRALDTRPTIEISAGQLCQVILTKPLQLTVAR